MPGAGETVCAWIEAHCGQRIQLTPWQEELVHRLFGPASDRRAPPRPRL